MMTSMAATYSDWNASSTDSIETTAATSLTVLVCSLSIINQTARVDSNTKKLIDVNPALPVDKQVFWVDWSSSLGSISDDNEYAGLLGSVSSSAFDDELRAY